MDVRQAAIVLVTGIITAPFWSKLFSVFHLIIYEFYSAARPETSGKLGRSMDSTHASAHNALDLLAFASNLEIIAAALLLIGAIATVLLSSGAGNSRR